MGFAQSTSPACVGIRATVCSIFASLVLAACGGGGDGGLPGNNAGGAGGTPTPPSAPPPAAPTYIIGGSIKGLSGSGLVLQDNGGDSLTFAAGATSFTFATPVAAGGSYSVTLVSTPPNTSCSITNGGGVAAANVTNVAVTCSPIAYTVGGTVSGLSGSGLVLQDNGGDNLTVASGATSFSFATPIAPGGAYSVTILTQPANQTCAVSSGKGNVAAANITNVAVTCSNGPPTYTIGGYIRGLTATGNTLTLQDNGGDNLVVTAGGDFTFKTALAGGAAYAITLLTQPKTPAEVCTVTNGTGTVGTSNISNVVINCLNFGRFVYVVNSTDKTNGDVSAFTIDAATGSLTAVSGSAVAAHTTPNGIAIDSNSISVTPAVYVSNMTSADLTRFDLATQGSSPGVLTYIGNSVLPATPPKLTPASIAIAPDGTSFGAYVVTGGYGTGTQGAIYGIQLDQYGDEVVPSSISIPPAAVAADGPVLGIAIDTKASLVFATTSSANLLDVYSIGAYVKLTAVTNGPYATGKNPSGVVVWPQSTANSGFVYTANKGDNTISAFVYGGTPRNLQPATTFSTGKAPVGIAIDPTGTYLYTANSGDGTVSAFSIKPTTGALTSLAAAVASGNLNPTVNPNPGPIDLKVDPSGQFVYCVNGTDGSVSLFTVQAGALTLSQTYPTGAGAAAIAIY